MRTRILTGLVLAIAFVLLALYLPSEWVGVVILAIMLLALEEWNRLTIRSTGWLLGLAATLILSTVLLSRNPAAMPLLCIPVAAVWIYQAIGMFRPGPVNKYDSWLFLVLGAFMLLGAWSALMAMHNFDGIGPRLMISAMAIVWAADSFAYFTGKSIGRRKLAPTLSPNKTIEGGIGGLVGAGLTSALLGWSWLDLSGNRLLLWIAACLVAAVISIFGDLFQSRLKRAAGVKDSGSLLPGHGGVLDRVDGVIAAAPVLVVTWLIFQ